MILEPTAWNHPHKQAGINSFGFGGTNAHMVVQNYWYRNTPMQLPGSPYPCNPWYYHRHGRPFRRLCGIG
ncbi:MAG: hypothetical protein H6560_28870 [Lewinellaceae bacterium]|nr:hypothetical protein [Lewinellaceae bacterium]